MRHQIDLTQSAPKRINPLPGFSGARPDGETLSFTNYYMEISGAPFFGVSGEIHYARLPEARWEDAILNVDPQRPSLALQRDADGNAAGPAIRRRGIPDWPGRTPSPRP